jgi:hypothetical protein
VTSAQARGWGDPDAPGYRERHIVTLDAGGIRLAVHRRVAPLFAELIRRLVAAGYDLDAVADDWGYANRDVRGRPGVKSNHSWGLAIDLNATRNPMNSDPDAEREFGPDVAAIAAACHLEWGGEWTPRRDYMHFEHLGTPAEADHDVADLRRRQEDTAMAKLDSEDLKAIERVVDARVRAHVKTVLGATGKDGADLDPHHVSLIDVDRKLDEVLAELRR